MAKITNTGSLVLIIALMVFGCAPLRQAPLIYASKASVGVDLSGTTTEQPGVSISLGYKQIDAAYVPIAVAKDCDKDTSGSSKDCTHATYQIMPIAGNNAIGDSKVAEKDVEAARKRIQDFTQLVNEQKEAKANCKNKEAQLGILNKVIEDLGSRIEATAGKIKKVNDEVRIFNQQKDELADTKQRNIEMASKLQKKKQEGISLSPEEETMLINFDKEEARAKALTDDLATKTTELQTLTETKTSLEKQKIEKEASLPTAQSDLNEATNSAANADRNLQEKAKELPSIMSDIRLISPSTRHDAFSVFGSFDANTKTGVETGGTPSVKGEAMLAIGKVFSTGVAAQQLTEGMRRYYEGVGQAELKKQVGACLEKADSLISQFKLTQVADSQEGKKNIAEFMNNVISRCKKDGESKDQVNK